MKNPYLTLILFIFFIGSLYSQQKPKKIIIKPKESLNKEVYYHKNGKKNGSYSFYYDNLKQVEGEYYDELRSGEYVFYNRNGNIRI